MFNITSKNFSVFNNKPPASWVAHITKDFLTCYSCYYYSYILLEINLVSLNPIAERVLITSNHVFIALKRIKIIVLVNIFEHNARRMKTNLIFVVIYGFLKCPVCKEFADIHFKTLNWIKHESAPQKSNTSRSLYCILIWPNVLCLHLKQTLLFEILLKFRLNYLISLVLSKDFHLKKLVGI